MKLVLGSKNQVKINALKELIEDYASLRGAEIVAVEVDSSVGEQPKTLQETLNGAIHRAKTIYTDEYSLSFGIESGLMEVPYTSHGCMNVNTCAIYDGKQIRIGISSAYEIPENIMEHMFKTDDDLSKAAHAVGFTRKERIGSEEGVISILTDGKLDRKNYTKEAIRMALIHFDIS